MPEVTALPDRSQPALESARAERRARRTARLKHRGRRLVALALAFAVPAFAAQEEWQTADTSASGIETVETVKAMPFETGGKSFPGSAFYYLEDAPMVGFEQTGQGPEVLFDISGTGDAEATGLAATRNAGPAARAFLSAGSGLDKARALQCLANAVYYEAASEALGGQRAVAQVVLNRVAHPSYPNSVCGVVYQGSERRTGCQFSFTCDGSLGRKPSRTGMARARMVAQDALSGTVYEPVGLATHYHTVWIHPYWAPSLDHIGTVGAHRFYKWRGAAGKPNAFRASYRGGEPAATPPPRIAVADASVSAADPLSLARAYEQARLKALAEAKVQTATAKAPAPNYSDSISARGGEDLFVPKNLPEGGDVKPEYANSGRWIAEPN